MDTQTVKSIVVLTIIFGTGVVIAVSLFWMDYRKRTRALDVLKAYAERGEEPPASLLHALTGVAGSMPHVPGKPPTRATHLAHAAANTVFTVGLALLAWWRLSAFGETGPSVVVPILATLFFAASVAARLVGAYYTPDR
jgi:hypothetical protein